MKDLQEARILVADDESQNVRLLELILADNGFRQVLGTTRSRDVIKLFQEFKPDLVLLDLTMPEIDGFEVLKFLRPEVRGSVQIMVLTADHSSEAKHQALAVGADDFLTKPFDALEVGLRIRNLLRSRLAAAHLESVVTLRTQEVVAAHNETVQRLALAAEFRDDNTGLHAARVGHLSGILAKALGIPPQEAKLIEQAAALHDIGKIAIPDSILLKAGPLSASEYETMKEHTRIGAKLLSGSSSAVLQLAESIAMYHHERWDGRGYWGLGKTDIPASSRIVALVDSFDAMTHDRPYKTARSLEDARIEICAHRGSQFDPTVVDAFLIAQSSSETRFEESVRNMLRLDAPASSLIGQAA